MRALFLAFVTSAVVFSTGPSPASANDYLYCFQGGHAVRDQGAARGDGHDTVFGFGPDSVLYGKS